MFGFDPVSWILGSYVNAVISALGVLMRLIETAVLNRPDIDEFPFYDEMGGIATGSARPIAMFILYFVLAAAVFLPKARGRVIPSAIYAAVVTFATPYWYRSVGVIQDLSVLITSNVLGWFGNVVSISPEGVESAVGDLLQFDLNPFAGFDALIGSFMLTGAFASGGILVAVVWCYALLTQLLAFLGLFAIALLGLGVRVEKFFQGLLAVGLVAIVFGIPVVVLILEAGIAFIDSPFWAGLGADSAFATGMVVNITFALALLSQVVLLILFFKQTQYVMGKLRSIAAGGELNARLTGRQLSSEMNQNQAVSRAMTEPERALAKENPELVNDRVLQSSGENTLTSEGTPPFGKGSVGQQVQPVGSVTTKDGTNIASEGHSKVSASIAGQAPKIAGQSPPSAGATARGSEVAIQASRTASAGARVAPVTGASGASATVSTAATSAATPATAGAAAATGAPTAGVGAVAVVGAVAAKKAVDHVKERKEEEKDYRPPSEESSS